MDDKLTISLTDNFRQAAPLFVGVAILAKVNNEETNDELWLEIDRVIDSLSSVSIESIKENKNINATRKAYRQLGKDPNRYRPSAEALQRRINRGLGLYKINTLVDLINLISLQSGYSIGGFDADEISGNHLLLSVGTSDDVFEGIGRGNLNIEGLPVYRDAIGGIGTPTSDEERTKITLKTTTLLMLINAYAGKDGLQAWVDKIIELLHKYSNAKIICQRNYD